MSSSKEFLYPPDDILNPVIQSPNYEYIILWMLAKNQVCEWAHFKEKISESTLSNHINSLIRSGHIDRFKKGHYKITKKGREYFSELAYYDGKEHKTMVYPPKAILRRREYEHVMLWMLYHNGSCKWSDFQDPPLRINNSSLSKSKNALLEANFIRKEDKEYFITDQGKREYFEMLKQYDLDRYSILEEEEKRIEKITEKTVEFFNKFEIYSNQVKFRFLNNIIKMNYSKVQNLLNNEEDFNKIVLFLSINHPDYYPEYTSIDRFASEHSIDSTTLEFFVRKIVDENLYPTKFYKLVTQDKVYYFQANGKLERILHAVLDDQIEKFTYLNKLNESEDLDSNNNPRIETVLNDILNEICTQLFHEGLKPALREFLPEYIKHLYKIEIEDKLMKGDAVTQGFLWQNVYDGFETFNPTLIQTESGDVEYAYSIDHRVFTILDSFFLTKLKFLEDGEFQERYDLTKIGEFNKILHSLKKGKIQKAKRLIESIESNLEDLQKLILQDLIMTYTYNFETSIEITNQIIENYTDEAVGYLFQSITYSLMEYNEEALEVIKEGKGTSQEAWIACQEAQVLSKLEKQDEATRLVDTILEDDPDNVLLLRTKMLINMSKKKCCIDNPAEHLETLEKLIKLKPKDNDFIILKAIILCALKRYKDAKRFIKDYSFGEINTEAAKNLILTISYLARGKYEKALKYGESSVVLYDNYHVSYATRAIALGYNLMFKFIPEDIDEVEFTETMEKAIALAPLKSTKIMYMMFQASVLHEIDKADDAIDIINKAIETAPNNMELYYRKLYFLQKERRFEAIDLIDQLLADAMYKNKKRDLMQMKSFVYFRLGDYASGLNVMDEILSDFPDDTKLLNNKAIFLVKLGRKQEAIETSEKMVSINPTDGNLFDSYGEVLMNCGDYEAAIAQFNKAIEIDEQGWYIEQTYLKMGNSYKELGLYEKAKECFEKGKKLGERLLPTERQIYEYNADELLLEVEKELNKKSK